MEVDILETLEPAFWQGVKNTIDLYMRILNECWPYIIVVLAFLFVRLLIRRAVRWYRNATK